MSLSRRLTLVLIAAIVGLGIGAALTFGLQDGGSTIAAPSSVAVGGPFRLVDQDGKPRGDSDFRGQLMLIYFGYSYCPDACPTALQTMVNALDLVGPAQDQVAPIFVTIDPARDTPEHLKGYVPAFSPRLVGLTGDDKSITAAERAFRVYAKKSATGGATDYLMDHSSIIYLMGRDGKFVQHFTHETDAETIAAAIRRKL